MEREREHILIPEIKERVAELSRLFMFYEEMIEDGVNSGSVRAEVMEIAEELTRLRVIYQEMLKSNIKGD